MLVMVLDGIFHKTYERGLLGNLSHKFYMENVYRINCSLFLNQFLFGAYYKIGIKHPTKTRTFTGFRCLTRKKSLHFQ